MRRISVLLFVILLGLPLHAQYRNARDTVYRAPLRSDFNPTQLIAPGVLMTSGVLINNFWHKQIDYPIRDEVQSWGGDHNVYFDDYLQYAPLVMDLGLAFTGVPSEHGFVDRVIEGALAYAACASISWPMKIAFGTTRPNGYNQESFPSGHTTFVFTGAELVRMEYGNGWGAGAYAVAATVAFMRVYRNWHWFSDVLAGAGIGILSAHIGGWLLEPFKDLWGIRSPEWGAGKKPQTAPELAFSPVVDPVSGTVCAGISLNF